MVEDDRLPHRVVQPLLALALLGERRIVVTQRDTGARREPLDRFDEVEMLDLTDERDRVAALVATETIAREDVVLERESMRSFDLRTEDLFDSIGLLDGLDNPAAPDPSLVRACKSPAMLRQQEKVFREILVDEVNAMEIADSAVDSTSALRRDAVGADPHAGAQQPHELEVLFVGRVQNDCSLIVDTTIGSEVAGEPTDQIAR